MAFEDRHGSWRWLVKEVGVAFEGQWVVFEGNGGGF